MGGSPTYVQTGYAWYLDDGLESATTRRGPQNFPMVLPLDVPVILRIGVGNSGTGTGTPTNFTLMRSLNGAAYTAVTTSSTVVKAVNSAFATDGTATTNRLNLLNPNTAGAFAAYTFTAGECSSDGVGAGVALASTPQLTELAFCIQFLSAGLAQADKVEFQVYNSASPLTAYFYIATMYVFATRTAAGARSPRT